MADGIPATHTKGLCSKEKEGFFGTELEKHFCELRWRHGRQVAGSAAQTALAADLVLTGDNVWPFDAPKQASLVAALGAVLPGLGPGAISVISTGAPFRRRRSLLQARPPSHSG